MSTSLDKIIKGCIANKRQAQEILYKQYFPKMYSLCLSYTRDEDKAMMICNDGFLKVFKNVSAFAHKGSFEGWIRRIIFSSISDFFRKENKYLKMMIFEEAEKNCNEDITDKLYYDDLLKLVNKLPGNTYKVFSLYAIEGYTHKEIGVLLNISSGTSKWHLSEARKKLKDLLQLSKSSINHAG